MPLLGEHKCIEWDTHFHTRTRERNFTHGTHCGVLFMTAVRNITRVLFTQKLPTPHTFFSVHTNSSEYHPVDGRRAGKKL